VDKYKTEGNEFHRLFLHSGFIMEISSEHLTLLLDRLSQDHAKNRDYIETLDFIKYLLERERFYENMLHKIFMLNSKYISIDAIYESIQKIRDKLQHELSIESFQFPEYIIESQYEHILDSLPEIVEFIRRNKVVVSNELINERQLEVSNQVIEIAIQKSSIRVHLLSIMMELNKVRKIQNFQYKDSNIEYIYLLTHNISYWKEFEIYRDLNFSLYIDYMSKNDELKLMKEVGFVKNNISDVLHFDFAKGTEYLSSLTISSAVKLLQPMYGDFEECFIVGDQLYSINLLIEVLRKIYELLYRKNNQFDEKTKVHKYGERALIREAGIDSKHINLLRLLSFDINNKEQKEHLVNFKPLIRIDKIYYLIPSHFNRVSIEKCIDKILSSEVKMVNSSEGKKGYLFEYHIESFFRESNIEFGKVSRDEKKGIPEFDGIFILDEYIFFYDAKASIKPENIQEAYNNFQSVFIKGFYQMIERINALQDAKKRKVISEKSKLNLEKKKLAPFIISNHFYFNGYRELVYIEDSKKRHIPIIDFSTLQKIIKTRKYPVWIYDSKMNSYRYFEQNFLTAKELYNYLCNQIEGLVLAAPPLFQLTDDRI
jgi:hypothetical protein